MDSTRNRENCSSDQLRGPAGYVDYNVVAKKLDRRLAGLGALEILPRGLGDDQHPWGYEAALDPWMQELWTRLVPKFQPAHPSYQVSPKISCNITAGFCPLT